MNSDLESLIQNPQDNDKIIEALQNVKKNWKDIKDTTLNKKIIAKAIKLKKMKIIIEGFNKCLGDGKNEKILATSILKAIEAIPEEKFISTGDCLESVLADLSVINENELLEMYAPVDYVYKRQKEKDYQQLVNTRWEKLLLKGEEREVDDLTEKIEIIDEAIEKKEEKKRKAKEAMRDKLYKKVRQQMVHMHGMFNFLLEEKKPRSEEIKIEESLEKSCPGCPENEIAEHRKNLQKNIQALKDQNVKPVNTERFRNKIQNNMIELAGTAYKIDERRVYDKDGKIIKRKFPEQDLREYRINYKFNPKTNTVSNRQEALEAERNFLIKKREIQTTEYGQLAKLGIVPNLNNVKLKVQKEQRLDGKSYYRMIFISCSSKNTCENLFEKEPENPFQLANKIGETFGMKGFDLEKFKKERLGSIEDAMENFEKLYEKGSLDNLLDKLILNNPVTAGELLAESPEEYLQILCERIKIIGKDKDFDETMRKSYLNATAALIIGGFIFMGPIAAAPLAGKVLLGSWYSLTGVSAYFGIKAYQNEDFAKASCYTGTGDKNNCSQIEEYYNDKKYAILFGVMVPGSDLLRIADVATKSAGMSISVKKFFDTAASTRGRVVTFKGQGENIVNEATHYQAEKNIKAILNLSDEELDQLPLEERKEIVEIIQEIYKKDGDKGVEGLVLAIRTIKDLEKDGHKVEKILSGKALLDEARRLQYYYESR